VATLATQPDKALLLLEISWPKALSQVSPRFATVATVRTLFPKRSLEVLPLSLILATVESALNRPESGARILDFIEVSATFLATVAIVARVSVAKGSPE
jgi:hypothetical protein